MGASALSRRQPGVSLENGLTCEGDAFSAGTGRLEYQMPYPDVCGSRHPQESRRGVPERQGSTTLVMVSCLSLIGVLAVATLDVAWVCYKQHQLRINCESAALAGASHLMDPTCLYATSPKQGRAHSVAYSRILRARQSAAEFGRHNTESGKPFALDLNLANAPQGDIVVGWVEEPSIDRKMDFRRPDRKVNSLTAQVHRTRSGGNPLSFRIGQRLGLLGADRFIGARASIDQRIVGFRPVGPTNIPLVPLAIRQKKQNNKFADHQRQNGMSGAGNAASSASANDDRYAVDPATQRVRRGQDGIREFTVVVARDGDESTCRLLKIGPPSEFGRQCRRGLSLADTRHIGLDGALLQGMQLPVVTNPDETTLRAVCQHLQNIRGEKRIWAIVRCSDDNADRQNKIIEFTAAAVVECELRDNRLRIVLQPCLIQTCTAILRQGAPHNRQIGKLVLSG